MRKEKENSVLLIVFYFRWRLDSSNRPVFTPEWQCGQHRKCWARSRARSRARSLHSSCSHDLDSCANFLVSLTSILLFVLQAGSVPEPGTHISAALAGQWAPGRSCALLCASCSEGRYQGFKFRLRFCSKHFIHQDISPAQELFFFNNLSLIIIH